VRFVEADAPIRAHRSRATDRTMGDGMRVLRFYHAGRDPAHRLRERALAATGIEVTLVVPRAWPGMEAPLRREESVEIIELPVERPGDVNRHCYAVPAAQLSELIQAARPDVVDLHEEPVSRVAAQLLPLIPRHVPATLYTAQNLDKRFPPPFARRERRALARAAALYPCSRQAASVVRGKGFVGAVEVLPLGYDDALFYPGDQDVATGQLELLLVGRLVPEKGVRDAVELLALLGRTRDARLTLVGEGPEEHAAVTLARSLGVVDRLQILPWTGAEGLATAYRQAHVVLIPSRTTPRWVEQFGRVIVEAHASGAMVAGYRTGSIPEVAERAAVLVPEGEVHLLAERVDELAAEPEAWAALRREGMSLAQRRTWAAVAEGMRQMYDGVVADPPDARGLPWASTTSRMRAVVEFGPPATVLGQSRPFALPVLRDRPAVGRLLGAAVDAGNEVIRRAVARF
jgi:glycosyltransferase involved in cell wall biosynthesis